MGKRESEETLNFGFEILYFILMTVCYIFLKTEVKKALVLLLKMLFICFQEQASFSFVGLGEEIHRATHNFQ